MTREELGAFLQRERMRGKLFEIKLRGLELEQRFMETASPEEWRAYVLYKKELEKRYNHNHDPKTGRFASQSGLTGSGERGIINNRKVNGQRRDRRYILNDEEIANIKQEAEAIGIPVDILKFNEGNQTGFLDFEEVINIKGDVFPDENSEHNRDKLSVRAVLAHEYYGHFMAHPSEYPAGDWRDEFNASYNAAVKAPTLSDEDRARLMIDAYDRAREAGYPKEYDETARSIIYGK